MDQKSLSCLLRTTVSMATSSSTFSFIISIILVVNLTPVIAGDIILEEGYTVTTVIDGDKLQINPYSVLTVYGSSSDLIILDSVKSTFYTVSFSNSQETMVKRLSGNGVAGYLDGDLGSAMFNKPKSFALDMNNNIYIADKNDHTIRKISKSGVTTIAGGYTQKTGKVDGPAQNASFSDDFELAFSPQRCALLISDHGNRLVRQINLKADDCADSSSASALGSSSAWAVGVGIACLLVGFLAGFAVRHYSLPTVSVSKDFNGAEEALGAHLLSETWKHFLINLGKQVLTFFFDIRSAVVSLKLYELLKKLIRLSLSQLSLIFGLNIVRSQTTPVKYASFSLLDCDDLSSSETTKSQSLAEQLSDLLTFDNTMKPLLEQEAENKFNEKNAVFSEAAGKLDSLIDANIAGFAEVGK